ncbi:MAG: asparagine synthetase B family protein [Gammaproteobacteria bacterium]
MKGFAGRWPERGSDQAVRRHLASAGGPGIAGPTGVDCHAPALFEQDDIIVAARGQPSLAPRELLDAYRSHGAECLDRLTGAFSIAIIDRPRKRALLAVDRMGIERMAFGLRDDGIVFSSSVAAVARCRGIDAGLRPQSLYDFLLLHMVPAPATVHAGVQKLRAGTCVVYEGGRVATRRYWTPRFADRADASFPALHEELKRSLTSAVRDCHPDEQTGAFLSGGLDSSTVAGLLGLVSARPPRTFSIGFGVEAYNELQYAAIANRRFRALASEYRVRPEDVVTAIPLIAAAFDEPFGNSSAVPTYFCAKLAADAGVNHLLAGDGGDELFGGNERYARQRVFEAYGRVPSLLRRALIEPVARRIRADSTWTWPRKFRSYVDQARIPLPERLESWNLVYRTDPESMLEPEFRRSIDPRAPLCDMGEVYRDSAADSLLDRMQAFDWQYTLSDNDLRKVGVMCRAAGVRVSFPMLDQRVIDLSLRVPARHKLRGLELRTFYKRAMADFLPPEIIAKTKHGFGLPFGDWLKSHAGLAELIHGLLAALKRRRIVRADFIDGLISGHRTGHASYFGYAIWDLAMLEAWLQSHGSGAATAART